MMYEIKGQKQSRVPAHVILAAVHDALSQNHGHIESEDDESIVFTSPFVQFNWNIFAPVSRGVVSVQTRDGLSTLSYQISLFRVRVIAAVYTIMIFTIMAIVMTVLSGEILLLLFFVTLALFFGWGWLYGMNYLITMGRVSSFFDRVLQNLPTESRPIPDRHIYD